MLLSEPPKSPGNEWEGGGNPYPPSPACEEQGRWRGGSVELPRGGGRAGTWTSQPRALCQHHRGIQNSRQQTQPVGPGPEEARPLQGGPFISLDPERPRHCPWRPCQVPESLELTRSRGERAFLMWTRELTASCLQPFQHLPLEDLSISAPKHSYFRGGRDSDISTDDGNSSPLWLPLCGIKMPQAFLPRFKVTSGPHG